MPAQGRQECLPHHNTNLSFLIWRTTSPLFAARLSGRWICLSNLGDGAAADEFHVTANNRNRLMSVYSTNPAGERFAIPTEADYPAELARLEALVSRPAARARKSWW